MDQETEAIRVSGLFDEDWCLRVNPDISEASVDPLEHDFSSGDAKGRELHPLFRRAGIEPLSHYIEFGAREGRAPSLAFANTKYRAAYKVARLSGDEWLEHYLVSG